MPHFVALGMADVIQAYEAVFQSKRVFIDEGFGSLDEESLTESIRRLN